MEQRNRKWFITKNRMLNLVILFLVPSFAAASSWVTPSDNEIPPGASIGVYAFFIPVFDPYSNQLIQVWADSGADDFLYYSAYDGTSWSIGAAIPPGASIAIETFTLPVFDPSSNQLIQVWKDATTFLYYSAYDGTSWSTGMAIPPGASTGAQNVVNLAFDPSSNQLIQMWTDSGTGHFLYYSAYNGTSWSTAMEIPPGASTGVHNSGFFTPVFDPSSNQLIEVWIDSGTGHFPYYSAYDGTSWSTGSAIPPGTSVGSLALLEPVFDPSSNQLVQVWLDSGTGNFLYYSAYDGTSWSTGTAIPPGSSVGIENTLQPVFDSSSNQLVQVWLDSGTGHPIYYSAYDGTSWSTGSAIPLGTSTGVAYTYSPVFDSASNQLIQVWVDSVTNFLYYSVYDGTSWSTGAVIPPGSSTGVYNTYQTVFDPSSNQLIQVWEDAGANLFYSSAYNGSTWSTATAIPPGSATGIEIFVAPVFDPSSNQLIQVWLDSTFFLHYSASDNTTQLSGTGQKVSNRFPLAEEWFNLLKWNISSSSGIVGYNISRNGAPIATNLQQTHYYDYNRPRNSTDVYTITSVDANGSNSLSLTITVE